MGLENEIVRGLRKGQLESFDRLYNLYSLKLYHFGLKYLKSEVEAEGLVQNVFEKVWMRRESLKTQTSLKSYLFTIAFNFIRKYFNKKARLKQYIETEVDTEKVDFNTIREVEYHSLMGYIHELIDELPEKRKEVFLKCKIEDLPIKEVAIQMGISPKTVENQLAAAIKYIKENYKRDLLSLLLFCELFL